MLIDEVRACRTCNVLSVSNEYFSIEWPHDGVPPGRCLRVYKCCYILNHLSNISFGRVLVPGGKLVLITLITFSLFAILRLYRELDLFSLWLATALCINGGCILVPGVVLTSTLYKYSSQFQRNVLEASRRLSTKRAGLVLAKEVQACQLIRSEVGGLYHMEARAKLTICHSIVNGLVLLLVQHRS